MSKAVWLSRSLLRIRNLSPAAKLIYMALQIEADGSRTAAVSDAVLGETVALSRSRVQQCRQELERASLITPLDQTIKQIRPYMLRHGPVSISGIVSEPTTRRTKRPRQFVPCSRCKTPCVPQQRTGWCRACAADVRQRQLTEKIVQEIIDRRLGLSGPENDNRQGKNERP